MYSRASVIKGLLIVSVIGMMCAYAWAAQQSGQNEPNKPTQGDQATSGRQAGTAGQAATQPGAGAAGQTTPQPGMARASQEMTLVRTNDIIGKDLKNDQGEKLGTVHDIVLTPDYRQASYVALSSGGTFGVGSKLYAIPWQALHVGPKGEVTTSATKAQVQEATSFSDNNWPSQGDSRWLSMGAAGQSQTSTTPGQAAAGQSQTSTGQGRSTTSAGRTSTSPGQSATSESQAASRSSTAATGQSTAANQEVQMRRVTHLTGMEVKNSDNQDLGDLEEFAIDASNGHIEYDIIAFGGLAGLGEKYAAVPANAVRLQPQNHVAMLNTTKQTLESVAFSPSEFPDLGSPEYMQRLSKLFPAAAPGSALGYVAPQSTQELGAANDRAWGSSGQHVMSFNAGNVKTIEGTVQSVGTFKPEGASAGATRGLRLRVKTSDGKIVTVHAGPNWYAQQNNFFVKPGDDITVTGSESKVRERTVIVASELKKGTQTLQLRDQSGKPLWTKGPQGQTGQAGTSQPSTSTTPGASSQTGQSGQSSQQRRTQP